MPSTTPHASIGAASELLAELDAAIATLPEVSRVVGKLGRAESTLDPAPLSMIETMIFVHPEYGLDDQGRRVRRWRDHIRTQADLWDEISRVAARPGLSGAPLLQPISTRIVMLQTGMRGRAGLKVRGPDLETLERVGRDLEAALRERPDLVRPASVQADRPVGKPQLEVALDRDALARFGVTVDDAQRTLAMAIGGQPVGVLLDGRVRRTIRVRFTRDARADVQELEALPVPTRGGGVVPLAQLATVHYERGPQMVRSEDTFLTAFVLFDPADGVTDVDAALGVDAHLAARVASGELEVPSGVSWRVDGTWRNQVRASERLGVLIPLALLLVLILLYVQFRSVAVSLFVFAGVSVAIAGGLSLLWLWGLDVWGAELFGVSLDAILQTRVEPLTAAVWVGVIALIGIAVDDGVVLATYMQSALRDQPPQDRAALEATLVTAGERRIRPCLMTTATTVLALLPVLTSSGRGADMMGAGAVPIAGGMAIELVTLFVVPALFALAGRRAVRRGRSDQLAGSA